LHRNPYSLAETFDVGQDTGTQVDPAYAGSPFPFTGALDRVTITMTGRDEVLPIHHEFID
jgi:arylsulfatase